MALTLPGTSFFAAGSFFRAMTRRLKSGAQFIPLFSPRLKSNAYLVHVSHEKLKIKLVTNQLTIQIMAISPRRASTTHRFFWNFHCMSSFSGLSCLNT